MQKTPKGASFIGALLMILGFCLGPIGILFVILGGFMVVQGTASRQQR